MTEDEKIAETTEAPEARIADQQPKPDADELNDAQLEDISGGICKQPIHRIS